MKIWIWIMVVSCFVAVISGCAVGDQGSSLHYIVHDKLSKQVVLDAIYNNKLVVIVNERTNLSTIIEDRVVVDQWPSVTADITGEWHIVRGTPQGQSTPHGVFTFDELQHCPTWYPGQILDQDSEEYVYPDDALYWKIVDENAHIYGPCGSENPLGDHIAWFQGPYGYHGTSVGSEWVVHLDGTESRRVSGGCIRNSRVKIKYFFNKMMSKFRLFDYARQVQKNRQVAKKYIAAKGDLSEGQSTVEAPETLTLDIKHLNARIVVGRFKGDLPIRRNVSGALETVELSGKHRCEIRSDEAPIHRHRMFGDVVGYYNKGDIVELEYYRPNTREPVQTDRGWLKQYYVINCEVLDYYWQMAE